MIQDIPFDFIIQLSDDVSIHEFKTITATINTVTANNKIHTFVDSTCRYVRLCHSFKGCQQFQCPVNVHMDSANIVNKSGNTNTLLIIHGVKCGGTPRRCDPFKVDFLMTISKSLATSSLSSSASKSTHTSTSSTSPSSSPLSSSISSHTATSTTASSTPIAKDIKQENQSSAQAQNKLSQTSIALIASGVVVFLIGIILVVFLFWRAANKRKSLIIEEMVRWHDTKLTPKDTINFNKVKPSTARWSKPMTGAKTYQYNGDGGVQQYDAGSTMGTQSFAGYYDYDNHQITRPECFYDTHLYQTDSRRNNTLALPVAFEPVIINVSPQPVYEDASVQPTVKHTSGEQFECVLNRKELYQTMLFEDSPISEPERTLTTRSDSDFRLSKYYSN